MKKFILSIAAIMAAMSFTLVNANDIKIRVKEGGQDQIPRDERPVITANVDSGFCYTEISDYLGDVVITIEDSAGDTLVSQTETVAGDTQFTTDVSDLAEGSYTITYTLEDSTAYEGEFEKE